MTCRIVIAGIFLCTLLVLGTIGTASEAFQISISGPDGDRTIGPDELNAIGIDNQVSVMIDGSEYSGFPLWRVLGLADAEKILGPGDIITITGKGILKMPYPKITNSDKFVLITKESGPYLYVAPETNEKPVSDVTSLVISTTDEWVLRIQSSDVVKEISKDEWQNIAKNFDQSIPTDTGSFSGVTISDVLSSQEIEPDAGAVIRVTGEDGYSADIPWDIIKDSTEYLLADQHDGKGMPKYISGLFAPDMNTPAWPLILVDPEFPSENSVGNIAEIAIV